MAQPHFMWLVNFKIQVYWLESANGYDKTMELGPEISSSISYVSKIFRTKPIIPESLKL